MRLAFVDIETTGLDPDRHEIWEVGVIIRDGAADDVEHHWFLEPHALENADQVALQIGRYHERHPLGYLCESDQVYDVIRDGQASHEIAAALWDSCLVGANVRFDAGFLERFLRWNQDTPGWHHRLCDVESAIGGKYAIEPPKEWGLKKLAPLTGCDLSAYEEHTALGDARLARDCYDRVFLTGRDMRPVEPVKSEGEAQPETSTPITTPGGSPEPALSRSEQAELAGVPVC